MSRDGGRLILRVGTHKTAKTSFRESLKVNAQALAVKGAWALREIDFDAAVAEDGNIVPRPNREAGIDLAGLDVTVRLNMRATRS